MVLLEGMATQTILDGVDQEILSTTRLPLAVQFLATELKHTGMLSSGFARLGHYFTPYQAFVVAGSEEEFVKRTGFALLWSLSLHDKRTGDELFIKGLALIEREARDERNFVKKSVSMALRAVGRRNPVLRTAAVEVARRLAASADRTACWVGKDALRDLAKAEVQLD